MRLFIALPSHGYNASKLVPEEASIYNHPPPQPVRGMSTECIPYSISTECIPYRMLTIDCSYIKKNKIKSSTSYDAYLDAWQPREKVDKQI